MTKGKHLYNLVRNQFNSNNKWGFPTIKNQKIELTNISLMDFDNAKYKDRYCCNKTIHFFKEDYRFNFVFEDYDKAFEKLKQYYCLLTPDFSLYIDMPLAVQIFNTFKNRWCGAFWQSRGLKVIPTIEWGDERSFDFCFDGVENGSIVAISILASGRLKMHLCLVTIK